MRPKYITVHCSATPPSMINIGVVVLRDMHTKKGWSDVGYHWIIKRNGEIQPGRPMSRNGAGVKGHNKSNVHICLIGGVDENGQAADNYTPKQYGSLRYLMTDLSSTFGIKQKNIKGHRDWFGDINGDGIIDSRDWLKECPCFNVQDKLKEWM